MSGPLTRAMRKALRVAARRERGNICPTPGIHAAAQDALIAALDRRGFVTWDGFAPRINDAGRDAIAEAEAAAIASLPSVPAEARRMLDAAIS